MIIKGATHFSRKYYYALKYAYKFLVASSGMTNDGRELTKDDIERIVTNHNSGYLCVSISRSPDEWYNPLGVVSNLECNVIGDTAYLYAEVRVSEKLIELSKSWVVAHYFAIAITDDYNHEEYTGPRLVNLYLTTETSFKDVEELSFKLGSGDKKTIESQSVKSRADFAIFSNEERDSTSDRFCNYGDINITIAGDITPAQIEDWKALSDEERYKITHRVNLHSNGAHTGYVDYNIYLWGMCSPVREAAIRSKLNDFISNLQLIDG